jgi:hypothetical protein
LDNFDKFIEHYIIPKFNARDKNEKSKMSQEYKDLTSIFDTSDYVLRDTLVTERNLTKRQARQCVTSIKTKQVINTGIKYSMEDESTERL